MIKHVVTMDKDDFETLEVKLRSVRVTMKNLPDTHWKSEINRHLSEIEDILGIEPSEIPEAVTARWSVWYNAMYQSRTLTCTNCGYRHDMAINTSDGASTIPTTCPGCKAVMTGVE